MAFTRVLPLLREDDGGSGGGSDDDDKVYVTMVPYRVYSNVTACVCVCV